MDHVKKKIKKKKEKTDICISYNIDQYSSPWRRSEFFWSFQEGEKIFIINCCIIIAYICGSHVKKKRNYYIIKMLESYRSYRERRGRIFNKYYINSVRSVYSSNFFHLFFIFFFSFFFLIFSTTKKQKCLKQGFWSKKGYVLSAWLCGTVTFKLLPNFVVPQVAKQTYNNFNVHGETLCYISFWYFLFFFLFLYNLISNLSFFLWYDYNDFTLNLLVSRLMLALLLRVCT